MLWKIKKSQKNNCGQVGYVNIPYWNTGNVADIQCENSGNEKLDSSLDKLERSLSEDRRKFKMDDFFANSSLWDIVLEYINYLDIDLANSLINKTKFARNVKLLNSFKNLFSYTLNLEYVESESFKNRLEEIKTSVQNYSSNAKCAIDLKDKIHIDAALIQQFILSNSMFRIQHKEFYFSDIAFSEAFKNSLVSKEDFKNFFPLDFEGNKKEYVFVQSLLEFNNALSHLVMAVCKERKAAQQQNTKNAMNHFYRATLDNYKIIIRFSMRKVRNNKHIQKSFLSIRENEFLFLGEDVENKKFKFYNPNKEKLQLEEMDILNAYKTLFTTIKDEVSI